jgi:hypothetical protein
MHFTISSIDIVKCVEDIGLSTLLDLAGHVLDQEDGYWIKIEAWQVNASEDVPHGIRDALTLHSPNGSRILGYDNAHAVQSQRGFKFAGQRLPFDHKHRQAADLGVPCVFGGAHQLLEDYFAESDRVLRELKSR